MARQTIWEQMVEKQDQWIGGILHEVGEDGDTKITGMRLRYEEKTDQTFFAIDGEEWGMESDTKYLGVDGSICGDGWMGLSTSFGMSWRIKAPEEEV